MTKKTVVVADTLAHCHNNHTQSLTGQPKRLTHSIKLPPHPRKKHIHSHTNLIAAKVLTRKSAFAQHGSFKKLAQITLYRLELMMDSKSSWAYQTRTMKTIQRGLLTLARKSNALWCHLALRITIG